MDTLGPIGRHVANRQSWDCTMDKVVEAIEFLGKPADSKGEDSDSWAFDTGPIVYNTYSYFNIKECVSALESLCYFYFPSHLFLWQILLTPKLLILLKISLTPSPYPRTFISIRLLIIP